MMRFSIIIPTYQRREVLRRTLLSLARQTVPIDSYEVIVSIDGSNDGTREMLASFVGPHALRVVGGPRRGRAAACNAGAAVASGELLLFLDDDMEADPLLLAEHDRSHTEGADVVLGDLPLHPDSPRNLLSWGVGFWAQTRRERLTTTKAEIGLDDLLSGQLSISKANFERIGGFDANFTRDGLFGGEDIDFGYRAINAGMCIVFNPAAISYQYYDVDPAEYLRRAREEGRSSQELLLKHPEQTVNFGRAPGFSRRRDRWLLGPLVVAPPAISWPLRAGVVLLVRSGHLGPRLRRLFFLVRTMERLRGIRQMRAASSTGEVVVLAYHAIADLREDPVLSKYGVPPARFVHQLDSLASHGWTFVDLNAVLSALAGEGSLPRHAVLLTFDDAYADFLSAASPLLAQRRISAVVFAVTGQIGGTNAWDRKLGAGELELMDLDGLRAVASQGLEVGSHGVSHHSLAALGPAELEIEVKESAARLEALGLPRPRTFAYPHGEWSPEAAAAVRGAGYNAAFTVSPGIVQRGVDRYTLPRVEVFAGDTPGTLRLKVATAGWPTRWRERLLRYAQASG